MKENNTKGQILLLAFLLLMLLGIMVAGSSELWQTRLVNSGRHRDSLRAFYIAESGIERSKHDIEADDDPATFEGEINETFAGGEYFVSIESAKPGRGHGHGNVQKKAVTSRGVYGECERVIKVYMEDASEGANPHGYPSGHAWGWYEHGPGSRKQGGNAWVEE